MNQSRLPVVITGLGMVTPLGVGREASWRRLLRGETATRWLSPDFWSPPAQSHAAAVGLSLQELPLPAGLLAGAPAPEPFGPQNPAGGNRLVDLALTAAAEALVDAGLPVAAEGVGEICDPTRIGCVIGTSKGGLEAFQGFLQQVGATGGFRGGERDESAINFWADVPPHASAAAVASRWNLQGPLLCPVAACATGAACLIRAAELIQHGVCDIVLAGSTDASLQQALMASFHRLGVLARRFTDPAEACRPFAARREGFLIGEGAAVLVLESAESARRRRVSTYAEWLGGRLACDPTGLMLLDEQAESLTYLLTETLRQTGLTPAEIEHVNLHGTATQSNDLCETRAVRRVFGASAQLLSCCSQKGAIGHLLGAAGSVEWGCTLLAMRDGIVPPTANLDEPDPQCDLNYTPLTAERRAIEHAVKLSLGFGGHLVAGVVRKGDRPAVEERA